MTPTPQHIAQPSKPSTYIDGIGWRHQTEHRMTRWPNWKDSHKPGTYMLTLNVNGGQRLLGTLKGSTTAVYSWMKEHKDAATAASHDELYYRHALLGTKAMPFIQKEDKRTPSLCDGVSVTASLCDGVSVTASLCDGVSVTASSCDGVSTPSASARPTFPTKASCHAAAPQILEPNSKPRTHFPLEALRQPDAPHTELTSLGEAVKAAWERMPQVMPQIEQVCLVIMPNHIHAIIAVREELSRSIGSVIRSFMGTTTHILHKMIADGTVQWKPTSTGVYTPVRKDEAARSAASYNNVISATSSSCDGVSTPSKAPHQKPSLWTPGYCIGICQTEQKLHTRIGYVLENPFFGIMEKEQPHFMERTMILNIAGRRYRAYGNMLLLKEPDRMQVFCHRQHPTTKEPYHQTQDFQEYKDTVLDASADGMVIVTPGISPGEVDIMWAVLRTGGCVINIQREIPLEEKWHPDKERRLYCQHGQLLVLAAHDIPEKEYRDWQGNVIPSDTRYSQFHNLNAIAEELCQEGTEHECKVRLIKAT